MVSVVHLIFSRLFLVLCSWTSDHSFIPDSKATLGLTGGQGQ